MLAKVKSPLSRKSVLVSMTISTWTARKLDKKVTKETTDRYHAKEDAVRTNKLLIEKERLAKITGLVTQARDHLFYKMTKPWLSEGPRILPNALYVEFMNKYREIKREFDVEVDKFCRGYPQFIEERKKALNGLFNKRDYPDPKDIRSKFNLDVTVSALPDAEDFRSDLDAEIVDDIRRELEDQSSKVADSVMKHTADQIVEKVGHMAAKLTEFKSDPKKKSFFFDSLVDNVRDLAKLLPAFNLTNDPKLDALIKRIEKELCVEDAETLRDNDEARKVVAKSADDIVKEVQHLFG